MCVDFCQLQGGPSSVRFGSVTVRAWNGSSGSGFRFRRLPCGKGFLHVSAQFRGMVRFRFRLRFLKNGSDGSGSDFGSWQKGSDGSGFRFRFGSCAILQLISARFVSRENFPLIEAYSLRPPNSATFEWDPCRWGLE